MDRDNKGRFVKGIHPLTEFKKGQGQMNTGRTHFKKGNTNRFKKGHLQPKEWVDKQRIQISGDKCWMWKGGISKEPYGIEFTNQLKEQIRQRDNFRCQECFRHQDELRDKNNRKYKLLVHHIDFNKKNNNPNNLISLCRDCHLQTNYSRENWIEYFQNKVINFG